MQPAAPQHPFERKIVQHSDNLLIESKCALCGFRIVGSAAGTLQQEEEEHAERCPRQQSNAAKAIGPLH